MAEATAEEHQFLQHLLDRGRMKSVKRELTRLIQKYPDDPRLRISQLAVEASQKEVSYEQASTETATLVDKYPGNERLLAAATRFKALSGDKEGAIEDARALAEKYPLSHKIQETLAWLLTYNKSADDEVWGQFKITLALGAINSFCLKSVAYFYGRKVERTRAIDALQGSEGVERLALRTRGQGPQRLVLVFLAWAAIALFSASKGAVAVAVASMAVATLWSAWLVYVMDYSCCKLCRNFWIGLTTTFWIFFVLASTKRSEQDNNDVFWICVVALLVGCTWIKINQRRTKRGEMNMYSGSTTSVDGDVLE